VTFIISVDALRWGQMDGVGCNLVCKNGVLPFPLWSAIIALPTALDEKDSEKAGPKYASRPAPVLVSTIDKLLPQKYLE